MVKAAWSEVVAWRTLREAREMGVDVGHCIARRVKTICKPVSGMSSDKQGHIPRRVCETRPMMLRCWCK